ncbi:ChrR family anti-sigma-E factor [Nitrospirillum iridis]|uniref:Putative transcriptional regulator n=1 Tax=Nitrospirillum iridis TaxID=765888 RepID=A0A7X0B0D4_9PROT|nr:ChrR family anti-sigma-E factor [Nitrospirillum iridis]MBB6251859.1 putative transcriptional regulator [Nitrospirillum iridis]
MPLPTPTHHPDAELLARYAAGTLDHGPALIVATHLDFCPACRRHVRKWEALGGALLDTLPPAIMAPDALERTLARLTTGARTSPTASATTAGDPGLPPALRRERLAPWRFVAPGISGRAVQVDPAQGYKVMLFRVKAGMSIPMHGHRGLEYTCVIDGAFGDSLGHFGPGDMIAVDAAVDHEPTVSRQDGDCLCLIAVRGRLRIHSLLGRLAQTFAGL